MCEYSWWLQVIREIEKAAPAIGIIFGGGWAFYRFGLSRINKTALEIDLEFKSYPYRKGLSLVAFDIILRNKGNVKLDAKEKINPAYEDPMETLKFSADMQIRSIPQDLSLQSVYNFESFASISDSVLVETNLLADHNIDGHIEFYMEPNETYHLNTNVILKYGMYVVDVTFIGNASEDEFWRRRFTINISQKENATA